MPVWLEKLEVELAKFQTSVTFSKNALNDFKSFDPHNKKVILALIISQAKRGANFRPDGNGIRLRDTLNEFAKIKRTSTSLRVIYKPVENGLIDMQILAIGPRDRDKVYQVAKKRLTAFHNDIE